MKKSVIINADDFGLCRGVNLAVVEAHEHGVLTSATIMTNMTAASQAVELATNMPQLGLGVHLNLLEGTPLSEDHRLNVILDSKKEFNYSPAKLALLSIFRKDVRKAIEIETEAQIRWAIDHGINPTHLDSHKHIHTFFSIYPIVAKLARRFSINAIRWPFEPAYVSSTNWPESPKTGRKRAAIIRKMAKINAWQGKNLIKNDSFFGLAHTGKIDVDFWRILAKNIPNGVAEVMTHPGFTEGLDPNRTRLIEQRKMELKALCCPETRSALTQAGIELTHYGKL